MQDLYRIDWRNCIQNLKIMNYNMVYNIAWVRFGLAMFFLFSLNLLGFAQEETEKHRTYIGIEYIQSESQRFLTASLTARIKGERGRKKVADAEIAFYFSSFLLFLHAFFR